jgi:hypothetical protein
MVFRPTDYTIVLEKNLLTQIRIREVGSLYSKLVSSLFQTNP